MLFFFSDAVANSQLVYVRWGVRYVVGTERHDDSSIVIQLHVKYVSYNEIQAAYKHRVSIHNTSQLSSTTITCNIVNLSFPPSLPPPALPVILPFTHNWVTQLWCHARRGATPNQMLGGIRRGSKSDSRVKQVNGSLVITLLMVSFSVLQQMEPECISSISHCLGPLNARHSSSSSSSPLSPSFSPIPSLTVASLSPSLRTTRASYHH